MLRISDEQWELIRKHFPEEHIRDDRPGRKPIAARRVLEAVLWILNTGAQWHMLPQYYPNNITLRVVARARLPWLEAYFVAFDPSRKLLLSSQLPEAVNPSVLR